METKKKDKREKNEKITPIITLHNKQKEVQDIFMYCLKPTKRGSEGECHAATFLMVFQSIIQHDGIFTGIGAYQWRQRKKTKEKKMKK